MSIQSKIKWWNLSFDGTRLRKIRLFIRAGDDVLSAEGHRRLCLYQYVLDGLELDAPHQLGQQRRRHADPKCETKVHDQMSGFRASRAGPNDRHGTHFRRLNCQRRHRSRSRRLPQQSPASALGPSPTGVPTHPGTHHTVPPPWPVPPIVPVPAGPACC